MAVPCKRESRRPIGEIEVGMTLHMRHSTSQCIPWLVIGETGVSPILGVPGWRIMEMGKEKYINMADGEEMGNGTFTGRTSTVRPGAFANFHTVVHE